MKLFVKHWLILGLSHFYNREQYFILYTAVIHTKNVIYNLLWYLHSWFTYNVISSTRAYFAIFKCCKTYSKQGKNHFNTAWWIKFKWINMTFWHSKLTQWSNRFSQKKIKTLVLVALTIFPAEVVLSLSRSVAAANSYLQ